MQAEGVTREGRWQEWVISVCLATLSLAAVWTVFGDDIAQLISPTAPVGDSVQKGSGQRR